TRMTMILPYCCCDHPYLHSFPTRRSSDLHVLERIASSQIACDDLARSLDNHLMTRHTDNKIYFQQTQAMHLINIILLGALLVLRSEEHTSELQSRFDIVCRLLLEKKNINT